MGLMKEFKEFALRGNVIDMAVGIIMGAAFTGLVKSAVDDVVMPPIGAVVGGVDFSDLSVQIKGPAKVALPDGTTKESPAVRLYYGKFINAMINLFIVSLAIFILIKAINTLRARLEPPKSPSPTGPPPLTTDQQLLTEIRDLLNKRRSAEG